jgi:lipopolysaccharide exporter
MLVEKEALMAGVRSAGSSTVIINILQLVQLFVLARLLAPSDFGLMGMVTVVMGFASVILDLGIGNAIIHRQGVTGQSLSSLYWLNLLVGLILFCAMWAIAPLIVGIYAEPRLSGIIFWLSLIFLITPVGQPFQTLLEKHLEFGQLAKIETAAAGVGVIMAIAMALAGGRVFALVLGVLANSGAKALLLAVIGGATWKPSLRFSFADLEGYVSFGLNHVGQRAVNYLTANIDFFLIGSFLGAQTLGYYALAYNLASLPSAKINAVIARVFFPVFTQVQNDIVKLRDGYLRTQKLTSMIHIPVLFGMAIVAPVAVPLFFGEAWAESVLLLQILTIVGLFRAVAGTVGPLLLASGRPDLGFKWSLMIVAFQVPGLYLGLLTGGAVGVAAAFAMLQCFYFPLNYLILIRTLLGACLRDYVMTIWPFVWMSMIMAITMIGVSMASTSMPAPLLLAVEVASGASVYVALVWYRNPRILVDMGYLVFDRRRY